MKIECEKLSEREATPELIRELVRDGTRRVSAREVEAIFLDEYDGRVSWRDRYTWELVEGYGPSSSANGSRPSSADLRRRLHLRTGV